MIKRIIIILILLFIFSSNNSYATDEIIRSEMEQLNISSFIKEGQAYTKKAFPDININDLLTSAIKGNIDNKSILNRILGLFGEEFLNSISLISSILIVVIIHSILKAFNDNLQNNGVSKIAYYVEYIVIVTLIMTNFSQIIGLINETISNLVGFASTLFPILLALMSATRKFSIIYTYSTYNSICYYFYCKFYNTNYFTNNIYSYLNFNNFKSIGQNTNYKTI